MNRFAVGEVLRACFHWRLRRSRAATSRRWRPHLRSADENPVNDGTLAGTPFAGNIIPQNRISPISKKLLEFYSTPTLPGGDQQLRSGSGAAAEPR